MAKTEYYYAPGIRDRAYKKDEFIQKFGYDPSQQYGAQGPTQAERDYAAKVKQLEAEKAALPKLGAYQGISSLGQKGIYTAKGVTGQDIQAEIERSPWLKMALEKQAAEQAQRMNLGASQAQSAAAQARSSLASRMGLRGGAAERLGQQAGENLMMTRQNILGQGALERSGLGMQGADLASKIAQQNTAAENAANQFNVQANLLDLAARENRKLQQYQEEMKLKGGVESAKATASGGKK